MIFSHKPIMPVECIEGLNIKKDGIYVDATLGGAGHSSLIAEKLSEIQLGAKLHHALLGEERFQSHLLHIIG